MKKAIAMADNCIDVYYRMDRYYLTGNSIDFALNYKAQGGDVTEMTVLGNDVFAIPVGRSILLSTRSGISRCFSRSTSASAKTSLPSTVISVTSPPCAL